MKVGGGGGEEPISDVSQEKSNMFGRNVLFSFQPFNGKIYMYHVKEDNV